MTKLLNILINKILEFLNLPDLRKILVRTEAWIFLTSVSLQNLCSFHIPKLSVLKFDKVLISVFLMLSNLAPYLKCTLVIHTLFQSKLHNKSFSCFLIFSIFLVKERKQIFKTLKHSTHCKHICQHLEI